MFSGFESQMMRQRCQWVARRVRLEKGPLTFTKALTTIKEDNLNPEGVPPERFAAMVLSSVEWGDYPDSCGELEDE